MSGTCDVSIGGDYDGDQATVYNERHVVARKAHACYECREPIAPGTRHKVVTGLWEGRWETYRWCPACDEIVAEFSGGPRSFGVLWEEMEQNWDEGAHLQACLNRVTTAAAKTLMTRRWRKWKGLDA
jgi:hypothetical protein